MLSRALVSTRQLARAWPAPLTRLAASAPHKTVRTMSGDAAGKDVLYHKDGHMGVITLNRPKALNALTLGMVRDIYKICKDVEADDDTNVLVMEGAGEKAFCAGGDVVSIVKSLSGEDGGKLSREFFYDEYIADYKLATLKKPYVALMDGIAMGGGLGVSVNGRFRVASEKALCAMPETAIGLFPDVGGSHFLSRLRGELGMYLALTGARLKGQDVTKAGFATHYVPSDNIEALKARLAELKTPSVDTVQAVLDEFDATDDSPASYEPHMEKIDKAFSATSLSDIFERLESMADEDEWARKTVETMKTMSPTSMCVTFRQIRYGAKMSLEECFRMEYRLTQHFMAGKDFPEGVRAKLIDRNGEPQWEFGSIHEMSKVDIDRYFTSIENEWQYPHE